jgi:hypothetical protein
VPYKVRRNARAAQDIRDFVRYLKRSAGADDVHKYVEIMRLWSMVREPGTHRL